VLPTPHPTFKQSPREQGVAQAHGEAGRKGLCPCPLPASSAVSAPQGLSLTVRVMLRGAASLRAKPGRTGCAGGAGGAELCLRPRCFSSCQSSCAQRMGCKSTVLCGKGITQTSRQRAYWGYFQSNKISKNVAVRGSVRADALAPTRLLP